jgi:hypothetical protein
MANNPDISAGFTGVNALNWGENWARTVHVTLSGGGNYDLTVFQSLRAQIRSGDNSGSTLLASTISGEQSASVATLGITTPAADGMYTLSMDTDETIKMADTLQNGGGTNATVFIEVEAVDGADSSVTADVKKIGRGSIQFDGELLRNVGE